MHLKVGQVKTNPSPTILEIGAGTLNHIPYEKHFSLYDIVEPLQSFYADSQNLGLINSVYDDIQAVPRHNKYDKIIAIATFEHIENLPEMIRFTSRHINPDGKLCIGIPNEGETLWKLAYKTTTGLEFKIKYGLNYDLIIQHEHLNTSTEIEALLEAFYANTQVDVFGLSKKISLYHVITCSNPIELTFPPSG